MPNAAATVSLCFQHLQKSTAHWQFLCTLSVVPKLLKAFTGSECALQVLLTYVPANGAQRLPACITLQDDKGMRPLDVALATQQWQAVRLLIGAGALQACSELTQAQRQLQQALLLPDSRRPSGALPFLVRAQGSILSTFDLLRLSHRQHHTPSPTLDPLSIQ